MEANCVTHIGICVRDMDQSLYFYRDILGMKVLGDRLTGPAEGEGCIIINTSDRPAGGSV